MSLLDDENIITEKIDKELERRLKFEKKLKYVILKMILI